MDRRSLEDPAAHLRWKCAELRTEIMLLGSWRWLARWVARRRLAAAEDELAAANSLSRGLLPPALG